LYINEQQTCEGFVEIYFMPDVSEMPETCLPMFLQPINIGCNGTEYKIIVTGQKMFM